MALPIAFDPTRANVLINGNQVTGWAPDTKFTVTPTNSRKTVTEGTDGDISVNIDKRYSGTLTINLLQNSTFNYYLQSLLVASDEGNQYFLSIGVEDKTSGYTLVTTGWIQDEPEHGVGQETGTKTWTLGLANTRGNNLVGSVLNQYL